MRSIIAVLLFIAWGLGLAGIYSIGWFVHVLLVGALVLVYFELPSRRHATSLPGGAR